MLRACTLDYAGSWDHNLPSVEFAYNNSYHSSIRMAPYMVLYGQHYRTPVYWEEVGEKEPLKVKLIDQTKEIVSKNKEKTTDCPKCQKSYADNC